MASIRQSNLRRRRIRDDCRKKLSDHIYQNLGIVINPSDVRLLPRSHDSYAWKLLPEKEGLSDLFTKNLSDHSIGACQLICEEVGNSFEAVHSVKPSFSTTKDNVINISQPRSFSAIISQLKEDNAKLSTDLSIWRSKAEDELLRRQLADKEIQRLSGYQQQFEEHIRARIQAAALIKGSIMSFAVRMDQILPALTDLRKDVAVQLSDMEIE